MSIYLSIYRAVKTTYNIFCEKLVYSVSVLCVRGVQCKDKLWVVDSETVVEYFRASIDAHTDRRTARKHNASARPQLPSLVASYTTEGVAR